MYLSHCINIPSLAASLVCSIHRVYHWKKSDFREDKLFHNSAQNHLNHIQSPWQYENINVWCTKKKKKMCHGGIKKMKLIQYFNQAFFFFKPLCYHKCMMQLYCLLKYTHRQRNGFFFHPICLLFRHNHWFTKSLGSSSNSSGACELEDNKILVEQCVECLLWLLHSLKSPFSTNILKCGETLKWR